MTGFNSLMKHLTDCKISNVYQCYRSIYSKLSPKDLSTHTEQYNCYLHRKKATLNWSFFVLSKWVVEIIPICNFD